MPKHRERILLSWSGGKDSAMALHELRRAKEHDVVGLLTTIYEDDERVTMHGVGRELLEAQALSLGLPLEFVYVPKACSNRLYGERLTATLGRHLAAGVQILAFGDLFLDDIRDFREECLEAIGMEAVFPLWQRCTKELSWSFINLKFKAVITCVNDSSLPEDYAGRVYDRAFLGDLPLSVDPCGENGEFHTFVYDGPLFRQPIPLTLGSRYAADGFHYCELKARAPSLQTPLGRARSV